MSTRFNGYDKLLSDFDKVIYYHCPKCHKKAILNCCKFTCTHCGFIKKSVSTSEQANYSLWLSETTSDGKIWAYNDDHLEYLKNLITAKQRERTLDNIRNKSIGSRLPKWILSKKNRAHILKILERLEKK